MTTRTHLFTATLAFALALLAQAPLAAQTLSGFTPSEDYQIEIDGQAAPTAKVYWSQSARMFLIVVKDMPTPLLVEPMSRQVRSVPLVKLASRPDGSVGILEGAAMTTKGTVDTTEGVASFTTDGRAFKLVEKPPLLGWQTVDSIAAHSPAYVKRADAYQPQAAALAALRQQSSDVQLSIFFGSWCPFCQQKVPMAMRLARELTGSKVKFDFYGLPHGFSDDPQAKRYGVKSVPTGIVFVNGKEVGRISADGWASPETTLNSLVSKQR
jgi:thiol-disulfide isomerase/thioredoxin